MDINSVSPLTEQLKQRLSVVFEKLNAIQGMAGYLWFQDTSSTLIPPKVQKFISLIGEIAERTVESQAVLDQISDILSHLPLFGKAKEIKRAFDLLHERSLRYADRLDLLNIPDMIALLQLDCEKSLSFFQNVETSFNKNGELVEKYRRKLSAIQEKFYSVNLQSDPKIAEFERAIVSLEHAIRDNPLDVRSDIESVLAQNEQKALARFLDIKNDSDARVLKYREMNERVHALRVRISRYQSLVTEYQASFNIILEDDVGPSLNNLEQELLLALSNLDNNQFAQSDTHALRVEQYRDLIHKKIKEKSGSLQQELDQIKDIRSKWHLLQQTAERAISQGQLRPIKSLQTFSNKINELLTIRPLPIADINNFINAFETRMQEELHQI